MSDHSEAKIFSITMAYAAFRYCLGGNDKTHTIKDVIRWLELLAARDRQSRSQP